ncbi:MULTISPECIES: bifunctional glycosyltransferase/CDP-glycerol:glycerophosphate glycerophosphotransferase [unclassified Nocardioides]|uniref:bifunctional glycosyltransferase/CDP-glycerol:glycerophosphate glycerophosphotransferase n=1 Tax=unclassified Nocardioides TaxID=2615069 RepID=UPI0030149DC3
MRPRQRVAEALVRAGKATPRGIRGPIGRASRRFRSGWGDPLVTVVLAVSDEETTRIGPQLDELRGQVYRNLEVRVQPWGRSTEVRRVAGEHADADWRIRIAKHDAPDAASARNAGADAAKGAYLLFAGGGDNIPPKGLDRLAQVLQRSGSDFAVGRMVLPPGPAGRHVDSPYRAAHEVELVGTDLATSPIAVTDLGLGNRLLRTEFWRSSGLRFAPDRSRGTDVALASYAKARAFDLLAEDTYVPVGRRDGVSVGSMTDVLAGLDAWVEEHEQTWSQLEALGADDVSDWWLWGVLDTAIQPFVSDVERATEEQWTRLREHARLLVREGGDAAWRSLGAESRVRLWLLQAGKRTELEDLVTGRLFERDNRPTLVEGGVVVADLPFRQDPEVGVPDDCYVMTEQETPLVVVLRNVRWAPGDRLQLDLAAYVDHVGLPDFPDLRVELVRGDERVALEVEQYVDWSINPSEGRMYQDLARSAARVTVDAPALAELTRSGPDGTARWTVEVQLETQGLTRRGGITRFDERSVASSLWHGYVGGRRFGDQRVDPTRRGARFRVEVRPDHGPRLVEARVNGRRVVGALRPGTGALRAIQVQMGSLEKRVTLRPDGDLLRFDLEVPQPWVGREHARWDLRAVGASGDLLPVGWPDQEDPWLAVGEGGLALSRSGTGDTDVVEADGVLVVHGLELADGALDLTGSWLGRPAARGRVELLGPARLTADLTTGSDGLVHAALPTVWDPWGLGPAPVPPGAYTFELDGVPGSAARVIFDPATLDRLLDFSVAHGFRFRPARSARGLGVQLLPPLADDERGPFAQASLQAWARTHTEPVDERAVYLQSYDGATATDSQLAIHHELRRTHPELTIYWGVSDSGSQVPEGGVPVLMRSREWYRVLTTARYLCLNIDVDRWFFKRPGQQLLQTFHGYPAKSMGIRMWEAKGYTPRRIALELARTSGDWDLILTPSPEMDVYYRTEYEYDGAIHNQGYPRDDALVAPDAAERRADTRRRLGIGPEQKVVLYAPTWRDDLATDWRSAEMIHHLDLTAASRKLGPDYVLLMRGHRFHARPDAEAATQARLLDVSGYPEINDLILASDAAVLDYSSLRFDVALARVPTLFLVPDLAAYTGGVRGFLYPFEDSAPGPLLDTADEVIDWLKRLPRLAEEYAGAQEDFHRTYNALQDGRSAERVVRAFWG